MLLLELQLQQLECSWRPAQDRQCHVDDSILQRVMHIGTWWYRFNSCM